MTAFRSCCEGINGRWALAWRPSTFCVIVQPICEVYLRAARAKCVGFGKALRTGQDVRLVTYIRLRLQVRVERTDLEGNLGKSGP